MGIPTIGFGDLGPVEVWFGTSGSEVKVGETLEGVEMTDKESFATIRDDAHGDTPVDKVGIGKEECSVSVPFTRLSLDKLASVLPGASYTASGQSGNKVIKMKSAVGLSARENAKRLILKRIIGGVVSTATQNWIYFDLAYPCDTELKLKFDVKTQRTFPVTFTIFDNSGGEYWRLGSSM